MTPVEFEGANVVFAKDQPEYIPLPAMKEENGDVTTCWELTEDEKRAVQETGRIWLTVKTFNQPLQPLRLMTDDIQSKMT
jgi:hypothetical protein